MMNGFNNRQPVPIYGTNQVQGWAGAQQFEMAANQIAILVDSTATEKPIIFFKSTNEYGAIKSLRAYECEEITERLQANQNGGIDMSKYATRDEIYDIVAKAIRDTVGGTGNEPTTK